MSQCTYISEIIGEQCKEKALSGSSDNLCIFHEEIKKKDANACMKAFYEKIILGETNFEGFILKDVNFSQAGITQIGNEDFSLKFNKAKFYGDFIANGIKFIGSVSFLNAEFLGFADFGNAIFSNEAIFDHVNFLAKSNFLLLDFFREARFLNTTFYENTEFINVTFRGPAFFSNANFNKAAFFNDSTFERGGSFNQAKIKFASFENTGLKNVSFNEVNLTNFKLYGSRLKDADLSGAIWNSPWKSLWRSSIIREDLEAMNGRKICSECSEIIIDESKLCDYCSSYFISKNKDFLCPKCGNKNNANSKQCNNKKCDAKFSMKLKNNNFSDKIFRANQHKKAEDIYRNIKLNLQDNGDYKTAGDFYFNEMIMRRKRSFHERKILDWLINHINSKLCGYGERASRVIAGSLIVVFLLAFTFFINNAIIKQGLTSYSPDFLECLYFSFVTFTTLGYGDYAPTQAFQLIATAEAFFGAFMIALFVLVFGRKMLR